MHVFHNATMDTDIFILEGVSPGLKVKLTRIAQGLRQIDVACHAHVETIEVVRLEKNRYVAPARRDRILRVLGLLEAEGDQEED